MQLSKMLSEMKAGVAALSLLGASEILAIDVSAGFVAASSLGASGFLISATLFLVLFTSLILLWSSYKVSHECTDRFLEGIMAGATAGLVSSLAISALILLSGVFGRGIGRLMPESISGGGAASVAPVYAVICCAAVLAYSSLGAIMGAASSFIPAQKGGKTRLR